MLNIYSNHPNLNYSPSASSSRTLLTPEMEAYVTDAYYTLKEIGNVALLDQAHNGASTFLANVMEMVGKEETSCKRSSLYFNLDCINSRGEFVEILVSFMFWALSADNSGTLADAAKYLSDYDYELRSFYDEDGVKHHLIHVPAGENPEKTLEEMLKIIENNSYKRYGRWIFMFLDGIDRIADLDDAEEFISLIHDHLSNKNYIRLATATHDRKLYEALIKGSTTLPKHILDYFNGYTGKVNDPKKELYYEIERARIRESVIPDPIKDFSCYPMELPTPSKESVSEIVGTYFKEKFPGVSEECLTRLCDLSESHLRTGFELVETTILLSKELPSLDTIEEAFACLLNRREKQYRCQTARLSEQAQHILRLLARGLSFEDLALYDQTNPPSEPVVEPVKMALIDAGLIMENDSCISFVDPLYRYWIKNYFGRYPVRGKRIKSNDEDPTAEDFYDVC